jgi:hypothetical protein
MFVDKAISEQLEAELTKYDPRHADFEISKLDELEELMRMEQTSTRRAIERKLERVCDEIAALHECVKEASDLARASVVVDILCAMMIAGGLFGFGYMMSGGK